MTSTFSIKDRAASLVKSAMTHNGKVLAIRVWEPATFYEVDIMLPATDGMAGWRRPQKINILVAPFTFREYTPAGWDADIQTCTLYIDAGHDGPGSRWVRQLEVGDTFGYFRPLDAHFGPLRDTQAVYLGDLSAIGHFKALSQIAGDIRTVSGAVIVEERKHEKYYKDYMPDLPLQPLYSDSEAVNTMWSWISVQSFAPDAAFYLMGNRRLVKGIRRALKDKGIDSGRITAKGFWE